MRPFALRDFVNGIDRSKQVAIGGGATPPLYDLQNCYVTKGKTIKKRAGLSLVATLEAGTTGLVAANNKLNTFYAAGSITHANTLFKANLIPTPAGYTAPLTQISFGRMFLGFIYVVGTFTAGGTQHFYLDDTGLTAWSASTTVHNGDFHRPTTANGFRYKVTSDITDNKWKPNHAYAVNDIVQPSKYNGFRYKVTAITGSSNRTGQTEPKWGTVDGGSTVENREVHIIRDFAANNTGLAADSPDYGPNNWVGVTGGRWQAGRAHTAGEFVVPSESNGFVYVATNAAAGRADRTEPVWPLVAGNTVVDGGVTWKAVIVDTITWQAIAINKTGTVEPVWPTADGATIADNTVTWTAQSTNIRGTGAPNSVACASANEKIFAIQSDNVTYCATDDPRDWSSANDAGFLPTGLNFEGDPSPNAIFAFRSSLAVLSSSGVQLWQTDPDPAKMGLLDSFEGVGSNFPRASSSMGSDLFITTNTGVRSGSLLEASGNFNTGDIGQEVDPLVKADITAATYTPYAIYYPGLGQWWLIFGDHAYVYTRSERVGVSAWSRYTFPFTIDYAAILNGKLYLRNGNNVYLFDDTVFQDNGVAIAALAQWGYLDCGITDVEKTFVGFDIKSSVACNVAFGYDEGNPSYVSASLSAGPATSPLGLAPMEIVTNTIAPQVTHNANEAFELFALTLWFNPNMVTDFDQGPMAA